MPGECHEHRQPRDAIENAEYEVIDAALARAEADELTPA
jgi:hypothetical protein